MIQSCLLWTERETEAPRGEGPFQTIQSFTVQNKLNRTNRGDHKVGDCLGHGGNPGLLNLLSLAPAPPRLFASSAFFWHPGQHNHELIIGAWAYWLSLDPSAEPWRSPASCHSTRRVWLIGL